MSRKTKQNAYADPFRAEFGHSRRAIGPTTPLTLNRESGNATFELPEDGWYHLVPLGEFPGMLLMPDGKKQQVTQVLDRKALESMVGHFKSEAMIDYEHFSHDAEKDTRAAGWVEAIELRDDGIYSRNRWSRRATGEITGGEYRYISPEMEGMEHLGGDRYRPLRLTGAGLTNRPALKSLKPLSNREQTPNTTMEDKLRKMLIKLLGLAETATDEEIETAYEAHTPPDTEVDAEEVEALRNRNTELLEALVEQDLEKHKAVIHNRDQVKKMLLADRENALGMLQGLKAPQAPSRIHNRTEARTPEMDLEKLNKAADLHAAKVRNRASELRTQNPKLSLTDSYRQAEAEIPSD